MHILSLSSHILSLCTSLPFSCPILSLPPHLFIFLILSFKGGLRSGQGKAAQIADLYIPLTFVSKKVTRGHLKTLNNNNDDNGDDSAKNHTAISANLLLTSSLASPGKVSFISFSGQALSNGALCDNGSILYLHWALW